MNDVIKKITSDMEEQFQRVLQDGIEKAARIAELERALRSAHHLLANTDGLSKNNIQNLAGEEADAISDVLAAAPSAPSVEQQPVGQIVDRNGGHNTPSLPPTPMPVWFNSMPAIGVKLYAAPLAADTDKVREAILSILPNPPASLDKHESASYCVDFRAGLKAAAELVGSLAAQAPVCEVPGWKWVPIDPTGDMLDVGAEVMRENGAEGTVLELQADAHTCWDAMIKQAPIPLSPTHTEGGNGN